MPHADMMHALSCQAHPQMSAVNELMAVILRLLALSSNIDTLLHSRQHCASVAGDCIQRAAGMYL